MAQKNELGLKLNVTHQILAYAADVNLLGDDIHTIRKHRNIDASKEVGVEVKVEETKYLLAFRHRNAAQNRDIKRANRSF
jgi:hypothetical protein